MLDSGVIKPQLVVADNWRGRPDDCLDVVGSRAERRGFEERLSLGHALPMDQVAARHQLDVVEPRVVTVFAYRVLHRGRQPPFFESRPAWRYFAGVVIDRRETNVEPFVAEYAHVIDLHAVMFVRVVLCLSEQRIGEPFRYPPFADLLVEFIGVEHDAVVTPCPEIPAGGNGNGPPKRTAAFDRVDEQPLARVITEVAFVAAGDRGQVEFRPLHAVRGNGKALIQHRCLEAPSGIFVVRIIDRMIDSQAGPGTGRPMQPVCADPERFIRTHDPQLEMPRRWIPHGRGSCLDRLRRVSAANHGAPLFRLMQRPLEILDPGNGGVVQEQLPLSGRNTAGVLGSRNRHRFQRHCEQHCGDHAFVILRPHHGHYSPFA